MLSRVNPSARDGRSSRYDGFIVVFAMVLLMWVSEAVDTVADHRLDGYGIEPEMPTA